MTTKKKPRVLITGASGAGTVDFIRSLAAKDEYELIGCDSSYASVGFTLVVRAYVIPLGASPEFEPTLADILDRERPDFIVPGVDEEIPKLHAVCERSHPETRILTPTLEFCRDTLDKWRMFERLRGAGLSVARTWLAGDAAEATYPAIIKPRVGRGSRGLAFLDSPADLRAYLDAAGSPPDRFIVQERLFGREFTTSAVCALGGPLLTVVPKEATAKKGITQIGVTRVVPAIDALCAGIQDRLRADGPFNVQLVLGDDGVPRVFEINPRYSTTVALTLASGVDEVHAVLQHALGRDPGPLSFQPDLMMIRYLSQIFVPEGSFSPIDARDWRKR
jgi:carbamoyl-phosphate synthase large subunit